MAPPKKRSVMRDPLEAAKVARSDADLKDTLPPPSAEPPKAISRTADGDEAEPKQVASSAERAEWEVQKRITISWRSQMITLHPGTMVGVHTHGPGCIARMRQSGVSLKAANAPAKELDLDS